MPGHECFFIFSYFLSFSFFSLFKHDVEQSLASGVAESRCIHCSVRRPSVAQLCSGWPHSRAPHYFRSCTLPRLTPQFQISDKYESIPNPVVHVVRVHAKSLLSPSPSPHPGRGILTPLSGSCGNFFCAPLNGCKPPARQVQGRPVPLHH